MNDEEKQCQSCEETTDAQSQDCNQCEQIPDEKQDMLQCKYCKELIKKDAKKCKHCGSSLRINIPKLITKILTLLLFIVVFVILFSIGICGLSQADGGIQELEALLVWVADFIIFVGFFIILNL